MLYNFPNFNLQWKIILFFSKKHFCSIFSLPMRGMGFDLELFLWSSDCSLPVMASLSVGNFPVGWPYWMTNMCFSSRMRAAILGRQQSEHLNTVNHCNRVNNAKDNIYHLYRFYLLLSNACPKTLFQITNLFDLISS